MGVVLFFIVVMLLPLIFSGNYKEEVILTNKCHDTEFKTVGGIKIDNPFCYKGNKRMMFRTGYADENDWGEWEYFDRYERKDKKNYYSLEFGKYMTHEELEKIDSELLLPRI